MPFEQVKFYGQVQIDGELCLVLEKIEGSDTSEYDFERKGKENQVKLWIRFEFLFQVII